VVKNGEFLKLLVPFTPLERSFLAENDIVNVSSLEMLRQRPDLTEALLKIFGNAMISNGVDPSFAIKKLKHNLDTMVLGPSLLTPVDMTSRDNATLSTKPRTKEVAKKSVLKTSAFHSTGGKSKIHDNLAMTTVTPPSKKRTKTHENLIVATTDTTTATLPPKTMPPPPKKLPKTNENPIIATTSMTSVTTPPNKAVTPSPNKTVTTAPNKAVLPPPNKALKHPPNKPDAKARGMYKCVRICMHVYIYIYIYI